MSSVSSLGVGSNLDLSGLLDKLAASESAPLVALQKQQGSYSAKLTAYGTLQGALSSFQAAASKLADATLYQGVKVASSAADVLTATAGATGVAGTYSIDVTKLAQAQSLATTGVAEAKAAVGAGRVTIYFGTLAAGVFTDDPTRAAQSAAQAIEIGSPTSLEGLRDAINKKADIGVTASIVNDGGASPYRLVLNSTQTGAASSMRIAVTDLVAPSAPAVPADLTKLKGLLNHSGTTGLTQTIAASNAALTVNGISITSSTNTVKESVQGVTMTLAKTGSSTLTVNRDTASVESAVSAFVTAYNSLQGTASYLTKYDTEKKTGSALVGDSTLRTIQTSIRTALNTPQAGELQVLSKVGVTFQKDGSLALDATKLNAAFAENKAGVAGLFAGTGGSTGIGTQVAALVDTFTGTDGKLSNATAGVKATLKSLDTRYATTQVSVEAKVARYRAQFTQLDMMMSKMNATTSYLTSQFNAMNPSK
jgi:flagellar hook-associated protein 2